MNKTDGKTTKESFSVFTKTDPKLLPILEQLRQREPIFHSSAFGTSATDYERSVGEDYWEVGASGRRYSRDFILHDLYSKPPAFAEDLGWSSWDHALKSLGPDTYLITYVLQQGERRTRRASIWLNHVEGWRVLYHQGTVISAEEDDVAPV